MKKQLQHLALAGFALTTLGAVAQPTLTSPGMSPVIGTSYTYTTTSTYFAQGPAGASQTWNFASYTGTAGTAAPFVSVASTPYASSFPSATVAVDQGGGTYGYQKANASVYQNWGNVSGGSLIMAYSDPEDLLHFPFTYNNTYSDPWSTTFVNGGITFYRTGHSVVTADAYGTLTTPMATFTNVTRVHMQQIYQDSAFFGSPYVITYNNDEYLWYKDGTQAALAATYTFTNSTTTTPTQNSFYLSASSTTTGISEMEAMGAFELFPNPAVNSITLHFTLTENRSVEAKVFNSLGQQVQTAIASEGIKGSNTLTLDVSALPQGIYFAQMIMDGKIAGTKRFVVTK